MVVTLPSVGREQWPTGQTLRVAQRRRVPAPKNSARALARLSRPEPAPFADTPVSEVVDIIDRLGYFLSSYINPAYLDPKAGLV